MPSSDVKERLAGEVALWQADGIIDEATRKLLQERYDTPGFGLTTAVKYLGIAGGVFSAFGLLGLVAAASSSEGLGAAMLAGVGGFLAWAGLRLGRDARARYVHSSKMVLALGVFAWAGAVGVGSAALGLDARAMTIVVGLGVLPLAFVIAYRERNSFLLFIALLGFFQWVGSWSRMFGRSTYALDIVDPRAMAAVALAVFAVGVAHERVGRPPRFHVLYQAFALTYFNLSLLILSIYPERTAAVYIVVVTLAALGQLVLGARMKSPLVVGFAVATLGVDLFTRYCENIWDKLDLGLFFVVGGLLLMGFGMAAERGLRRWA
jgi:hypothetical protein